MELPASTTAELDSLVALISVWAEEQSNSNPAVDAVQHDSAESRWLIRLNGEEKDVFTVWFHLQQRSLDVETCLMPAPIENQAQLYEHLLVRNAKSGEFKLAIGDESAVFLMARLQNPMIDEGQLDRLLGTAYMLTERYFRPAMRIGYASKFKA